MPDEFVALDLETTGLSLESDRITEVGATRFDRAGRRTAEHGRTRSGGARDRLPAVAAVLELGHRQEPAVA